ncbi:MAG: archaellar assembly protein FlaJ [Archaeoglobaceae archaeon]|nr:archaellar assembly protein FlaJ [Archaeoglobaceae archaeon]MDW7989906.1 archaellar assembly protein FlaJ [Archaeoglobaceae archaeon]
MFETSKLPVFKLKLPFSDRLKRLKEDFLSDNDLLFLLTYMASLSTAHLSRDKIFAMASETKYSPGKYFAMVRDLTQKWHYDYATACELVAERIKAERVKKLFNRLANAISAGEPDREFLEREWKAFKTIRKDEYDRSLESLRKWSDAYTSLLVSASLISVVILLSAVIYSVSNPASTLIFSAFGNFLICLFGVFMLFKAVPKDRKIHDFRIKSKEQDFALKLFPLILLGIILFIIFGLIPVLFGNYEFGGYGFLAIGLSVLPIGFLAKRDDKKVSKRDEAFTSFIRSLGAIKGGAGVSIAEAIRRIDQKNLGELRDLALELQKRLSLGLEARICWEKFIGESGSYLVEKLTPIFIDSIELGGDANAVGEIVSSSNLEMVLLRLKRDLIASGFVNLIIPLHIAMVSLMLFIDQILTIFTEYLSLLFASQVGSGDVFRNIPLQGVNLGIFSGIPTELLAQYTFFIVLSITVANVLASNVVKGGGRILYMYYASILFTLSGILMLLIPPIVKLAFSLPSFVEVIVGVVENV